MHILGVTANTGGPWTVQQISNLLIDLGDRTSGIRLLVRHRAGQFTQAFDAVLGGAGVDVVKIPPCTPQGECLCGTVRTQHPNPRLPSGY